MNSYVLIVDDQIDILDIHEVSVKSAFNGEVKRAASGSRALEVIQEFGAPRAIISDYQMGEGDGLFLLKSLVEASILVPFILCSGSSIDLKSNYGNVHLVPKPDIVGPMIKILETIFPEETLPDYVPLNLNQLLSMKSCDCDLYVRLSETNYVKALPSGENFTDEDAHRYFKKSIHNLYVLGSDVHILLQNLERHIKQVAPVSDQSGIHLAHDTIYSVEQISKNLGWSEESLELAKISVDQALRTLASEPALFDVLKMKFNDSSSHYSHHVGKLALLTSAFCLQTEWNTQGTQYKLALASLIHDVGVDDAVYRDLRSWNRKAQDPSDMSEETVKYRNHPQAAATLLYRLKNIPPDVDAIILHHHQGPGGEAFARKVIISRISSLSAIFIIMEDLMEFVEERGPSQAALLEFTQLRRELYAVGRFKKIFEILTQTMLQKIDEKKGP